MSTPIIWKTKKKMCGMEGKNVKTYGRLPSPARMNIFVCYYANPILLLLLVETSELFLVQNAYLSLTRKELYEYF